MPLELNGYSAHIRGEEDELVMYDARQEDEKTMTCWIASEAGKAFTVHWGDKTSTALMNVDIYVDDRHVDSVAHEAESDDSCEGQYDSSGRYRPFVFALLAVTDDESIASPAHEMNDSLGTIRVTMTLVKQYLHSDQPYHDAEITELAPVHEKTKKAGAHAVSFGDPVETSWTPFAMRAVGVEEHPFATFVFRYRPLALLQANGIAPRPPKTAKKRPLATQAEAGSTTGARKKQRADVEVKAKPEPVDDDDDDDEETEELAFLQEQLAMIQRRIAEKKAARRAKAAVKREPNPIRVPSSSNEVIDLT
ncbi:hypothetical protein FKP32DRAFT_1585962 [Trametes sanguinea]|nr:hypothetical protein FKP32DRAFT_1585962 [Trametes sanguinea]